MSAIWRIVRLGMFVAAGAALGFALSAPGYGMIVGIVAGAVFGAVYESVFRLGESVPLSADGKVRERGESSVYRCRCDAVRNDRE